MLKVGNDLMWPLIIQQTILFLLQALGLHHDEQKAGNNIVIEGKQLGRGSKVQCLKECKKKQEIADYFV